MAAERAPVGERADTERGPQVVAQVRAGAQPCAMRRPRRSADRSSRATAGRRRCAVSQPRTRRLAGLLAEPPVEGARAHLRVPGQPLRRRSSARGAAAPTRASPAVESSSGAGTWRSMNCAWPPSRHGGTTQYLATALATCAPWSRANDVQAQVDSGGEPRRRQHVAVVDEQHVLVDRSPADAAAACRRRTSSAWSPGARRAGRPRRGRTRRCRSTPAGCRAGSAPARAAASRRARRRCGPAGTASRG